MGGFTSASTTQPEIVVSTGRLELNGFFHLPNGVVPVTSLEIGLPQPDPRERNLSVV
jgi:hypothetical protein